MYLQKNKINDTKYEIYTFWTVNRSGRHRADTIRKSYLRTSRRTLCIHLFKYYVERVRSELEKFPRSRKKTRVRWLLLYHWKISSFSPCSKFTQICRTPWLEIHYPASLFTWIIQSFATAVAFEQHPEYTRMYMFIYMCVYLISYCALACICAVTGMYSCVYLSFHMWKCNIIDVLPSLWG